MSSRTDVGDLENSLPSWISDHLGEKSYMADKVNQLPLSPGKDHPSPEVRPSTDASEVKPSVDALPPIEREANTMSQGKPDRLRESFFFPPNIQIRLLEVNETIASTRPGEVAFYEVAFLAGLCFSIHYIIRKILYFYNIASPSSFPLQAKSRLCDSGVASSQIHLLPQRV